MLSGFKLAISLLLLAVALPIHDTALAHAPVHQCRAVAEYPHDPQTSTQGLFYHAGKIYESSGGFNESFLVIADLETGRHLGRFQFQGNYFAEGISHDEKTIRMLTWLSGKGFIHDLDTLEYVKDFPYRRDGETMEGWGLTFDGHRFIQSSGTAKLSLHQPDNYARIGEITVRDGPDPVRRLNELEYVGGMVLANIWKSDTIAVIEPVSGKVRAWIDLSPLRERLSPESGVANGIAYDKKTNSLFVTGKHWDKLFKIEIQETPWEQSAIIGE